MSQGQPLVLDGRRGGHHRPHERLGGLAARVVAENDPTRPHAAHQALGGGHVRGVVAPQDHVQPPARRHHERRGVHAPVGGRHRRGAGAPAEVIADIVRFDAFAQVLGPDRGRAQEDRALDQRQGRAVQTDPGQLGWVLGVDAPLVGGVFCVWDLV